MKTEFNFTHYSIYSRLTHRWLAVIILCFIFGLLVSCSLSASSDNQVISKIESQYNEWKNTPYLYGGNTKKGTDCSGLVLNTFKTKFQINLPRTTIEQAKVGKSVSDLIAGDLVFFKTGKGENGSHVGIYYKDGLFLHVSSTRGVELTSLDGVYWKKNYWMARRIL